MAKTPSPKKRSPGRPKLGKEKTRISFTPMAMQVGRQKAFALGIDHSAYLEQLVRQDNPEKFPIGVLGGRPV